MNGTLCALAALAIAAVPSFADGPSDHLTLRYDHDSFFESYPTLTLEHPLGPADSVTLSAVDYLSWKSVEVDVGWTHTIGAWAVYPGLGTTFGPRSWGLSQNPAVLAGRDVVPQLGFYHSSPAWEAELYQGAWIPTGQESSSTSLWFTQTRWWAAAKRGNFGLGPQVETFGTKQGNGDLKLTQLWLGAHALLNLPKGSLQGFLGYDTISLGSYLGAPKDRGAAFQLTFIYPLF